VLGRAPAASTSLLVKAITPDTAALASYRAKLSRSGVAASLTLDFPAPVKYSILLLVKPQRLLIEIEDAASGPEFERLIAQLGDDDPEIASVHVAHPTTLTTSVVFIFRSAIPSIDAVVESTGKSSQRLLLNWSFSGAHESSTSPPAAAQELASTAPPTRPAYLTANFTRLLLSVEVNLQPVAEPALLLSDPNGNLYAPEDDLKRWRLRPPPVAPVRHQGVDYFALNDYAGLKYTFDQVKQRVSILAEAQLFPSSTVPVPTRPLAKPTVSKPGGFFNYDLLGSHSASENQRSGQFEVGAFNSAGVCTTGLLAPELSGGSHFVRLDTTCTSDAPEARQSWRLGDIVNRAGSWGGSVRMGGLQFGTNFGTQPGFINFPVQQAAGVASLPSAVDVYVNNVLTSRREVPPGPFAITNLPVVSGSGEVRLVVRDLLGREQVVTQPFYTSAGLLAAGLHDYSYEVGMMRENFGTNSNEYGNWAAVGTHRKGFSDHFTAEAHLELQKQIRAAGVNGLYLLPQVGLLNASLASSQGNGSNGTLAALGFERQDRPVSIALRSQWTSSDFQLMGQPVGQPSPARQQSMNLGYSIGSFGSLGFSLLRRSLRDQPSADIITASYNLSTQRNGTLMLSALRATGNEKSTRLSLIWVLPLGANRSASVTQTSSRSNTQSNSSELMATLEKSLKVGEDHGYRLEAHDSGDARGAFNYQNNLGTYSLEAALAGGQTATRAGIRGGVALLGGDLFISRWVDDSFGLARVPGFANVRVYADNHLVGQTNAAGDAMLPRLRAYERNQIRIEPRDLPMNAQVDALRMEAVPYYRSGVVTVFPVRRSKGALFRVLLENGEPLPLGATLRIKDSTTLFPVAYKGEVFVTNLAARNSMIAKWQNQSCGFDLSFEESDEALPDLGTFTCKGITP